MYEVSLKWVNKNWLTLILFLNGTIFLSDRAKMTKTVTWYVHTMCMVTSHFVYRYLSHFVYTLVPMSSTVHNMNIHSYMSTEIAISTYRNDWPFLKQLLLLSVLRGSQWKLIFEQTADHFLINVNLFLNKLLIMCMLLLSIILGWQLGVCCNCLQCRLKLACTYAQFHLSLHCPSLC